jgi:lipid-binding SYLF domain-containing protein
MPASQPIESTMRIANILRSAFFAGALTFAFMEPGAAQPAEEIKLIEAADVLHTFTADEERGIPIDLLQRARGIAIIPGLIRGGFIFGGRRGRGVLAVRSNDGTWSNPAFITLTGGSIGWQFGAESADVVLIFANDRSVRNIASGKFTLGGDATAVAGPMGRRSTKALTFKSEVYVYVRSRGLFAGAAFEGTRLDVDQQGSERFYAADNRARPLGPQNFATPNSVRRFLEALAGAAASPGIPTPGSRPAAEREQEAIIYPLEEAPL